MLFPRLLPDLLLLVSYHSGGNESPFDCFNTAGDLLTGSEERRTPVTVRVC